MELSDVGRRQARLLGRWLLALPTSERPGVVCVSPYRRAQQTWEELSSEVLSEAQSWQPNVITDERLRDREMGVLELMTPAAINERYPGEAFRRRQAGELDYCPAGGESLRDVAHRVADAMRDIEIRMHEPGQRKVLVVGHDATVVMIRRALGRLDDEAVLEVMAREPVSNASVSGWQFLGEGWMVQEYNTTTHLAP